MKSMIKAYLGRRGGKKQATEPEVEEVNETRQVVEAHEQKLVTCQGALATAWVFLGR